MKLENFEYQISGKKILHDISFSVEKGQHMAIGGKMGSGKSILTRILAGDLPAKGFKAPENSGYVSLSRARSILDEEREKDDSDLTDGPVYQGMSIADFIGCSTGTVPNEVKSLGLDHLLDRGIRFLSNGEMRKALFLREYLKFPEVLILDEPFEGMDVSSRKVLMKLLEVRIRNRQTVILAVDHISDIPSGIDSLLLLDKGSPEFLGRISEGLKFLKERRNESWDFYTEKSEIQSEDIPLIEMHDVSVSYDDRLIFCLPEWRVLAGEHWLIYGPNGCGKSSLLGMITGENVKGYGQDIKVFGVKKGSGECLWDLKKQIGYISREFHNFYRVNLSLTNTVVSGFFDSVGLYEKPTINQIQEAERLLSLCGFHSEEQNQLFKSSSYGQQRLALLLRALVKRPRLLILDEPCQGLDDSSRDSFLAGLEKAVENLHATVLYVTHRDKEVPAWIKKTLMYKQDEKKFL